MIKDYTDILNLCTRCNSYAGDQLKFDAHLKRALEELGYINRSEPNGDEHDPEVPENGKKLLDVASKARSAFSLPMYNSPGVFFFGAAVQSSDYHIPQYPENIMGVGGRGETLREAFESCMGEACEFLSFLEHQDDLLVIKPRNYQTVPPELETWLLASLGLTDSRALLSSQLIEAFSLVENSESTLFPIDLVLRRPEQKRIATRETESTGLGAGPSLEDAILSALLEVIERDAIALWWYGGNSASRISSDFTDFPNFDGFVSRVRNPNGRNWWQLDITSDLEIPTVATISSESDGTRVIMGYAAGLTMTEAMKRSFLEMCQMELAQEISLSKLQYESENELKSKDLQWIERANNLNINNYPELASKVVEPKPKIREFKHLDEVVTHLFKKDFHPYFVNLTRKILNIPVVKVLVPGLQSSKIDWISPRLEAVLQSNKSSRQKLITKIAPL